METVKRHLLRWRQKSSCHFFYGRFAYGLIVMSIAGSLTACMVGPDYERPELEIPTEWGQEFQDEEFKEFSFSTEALPEANWWRAFKNDELDSLIALALRKNHDLGEASYRVLEGRAITLGAGAGLYPQLNLDGSYNRIRRSETILAAPTSGAPEGFAPPGADFDIWNAVLDLRWELDLWGRIRRGQEWAREEAEALDIDRRAVMLSLISDVGQSYFRLRELDEQIEIAEKNLAIRQDSLNLITSRGKAGLANNLDVKRAEVLVAESAAEIPNIQRLRALELHRLQVLTGSTPNSLRLPHRPLRDLLVKPEIPVGLPSDLLERRPDIREVEHTLIAANARIGEARAYFFPSVAITGSGRFQTSEFNKWFNWESRTMTIGPSVTLPIFTGFTNLVRLEAAEARHEQLLERYQQTILNAFREVADLLVALQTRRKQLDSRSGSGSPRVS